METMAGQGGFKVGCCGFPGSKLRYFDTFQVVEVQKTFYRLPRVETTIKWRHEAPPDFEFCLKAWQVITHPASSPTYRRSGIAVPRYREDNYGWFRPSQEVEESWLRTREIASILGARFILFQCPPSFDDRPQNRHNMVRFFTSIDRVGHQLAWEPRGGWSNQAVRELCQRLELIHCVDPFREEPLWGNIRYFRLHGGPRYKHKFSDEELLGLRDRWQGENPYLFFNNLNMYDDALRFKALLKGR